MTRDKRQGLLFDADDTLWETEAYYQQAERRFYEVLAGQGGLAEYLQSSAITVDDALRLFDGIYIPQLEREGFSRDLFSKSLVQTYESLSAAAGVPVNSRVSRRLHRLGRSVDRRRRSPLPGARETLEALSTRGSHVLVLYSTGDEEIQLRKLRETGLEGFFEGRVYIARQKDDAALRAVISAEKLDIPSSWMIGNSLRTDVNPALRLGLNCIWFHNGGWHYDESVEREPGHVYEINALPEILEILAPGGVVRDQIRE